MYPSVAEALERRIRYREKIAARVMIVGTFTGAVCSFWNPLGFAAAGFSLVGLAATCLYAGNRQYRRSEGRRRPF